MKFYWGEPSCPADEFIESKQGQKVYTTIQKNELSAEDYSLIGNYIANYCNWTKSATLFTKYFQQQVGHC